MPGTLTIVVLVNAEDRGDGGAHADTRRTEWPAVANAASLHILAAMDAVQSVYVVDSDPAHAARAPRPGTIQRVSNVEAVPGLHTAAPDANGMNYFLIMDSAMHVHPKDILYMVKDIMVPHGLSRHPPCRTQTCCWQLFAAPRADSRVTHAAGPVGTLVWLTFPWFMALKCCTSGEGSPLWRVCSEAFYALYAGGLGRASLLASANRSPSVPGTLQLLAIPPHAEKGAGGGRHCSVCCGCVTCGNSGAGSEPLPDFPFLGGPWHHLPRATRRKVVYDAREADLGVSWGFTLLSVLTTLWLVALTATSVWVPGTSVYALVAYGVVVLLHLRWLINVVGGRRFLLLGVLACAAPFVGPLFYMAFSAAILWRHLVSY